MFCLHALQRYVSSFSSGEIKQLQAVQVKGYIRLIKLLYVLCRKFKHCLLFLPNQSVFAHDAALDANIANGVNYNTSILYLSIVPDLTLRICHRDILQGKFFLSADRQAL